MQAIHPEPVKTPTHLPFLQAICWQQADVSQLTADEMLDLYERGWMYRGVLADVEGEERAFLKTLAESKHSWLSNDV
ncbi:MAG: hypothetical protein QJT81_04305 [Candidatus Thiothrix putei]|uniref:Uncharacterized protein n=1 Tax=Candidatus Thiothrix putei TaxID=3080811 RepID=A0AA95KQZ2_9GAMM|nr:MAG: hypothetical protein QJT81_04305 [Candidatus Thiothrix putei]